MSLKSPALAGGFFATEASEQVRFQKEKLGWSRTGTEKVEAGALGLGKWV